MNWASCGKEMTDSTQNKEWDHKQMAKLVQREIRVWYDEEGGYLEVIFERKAGYFRETEHDAVMEKVDEEGNLIGFSILKVSALKKKPLSISLRSHVA
jgi:hypothetical protein